MPQSCRFFSGSWRRGGRLGRYFERYPPLSLLGSRLVAGSRRERLLDADWLEAGRLEAARSKEVADLVRAPLPQVGIPGLGANGVCVTVDLQRYLQSDLLRRLFAKTNLVRQSRERCETFRRDVVLVGQEINRRRLNNGLGLIESALVDVDDMIVERRDSGQCRGGGSDPRQPSMRCFAGKCEDAVGHHRLNCVRQTKQFFETFS